MKRIEIEFAVPVELSEEQSERLHVLISDIVRDHQPEGMTHWLFGSGVKPNFSQADSVFLGKPIDPNAPLTGEPTWDEDTLQFETAVQPKRDR